MLIPNDVDGLGPKVKSAPLEEVGGKTLGADDHDFFYFLPQLM